MTCRLPPKMVLTSIVHLMNEVIMHSSERVAETKEAKSEAKAMVGIWSMLAIMLAREREITVAWTVVVSTTMSSVVHGMISVAAVTTCSVKKMAAVSEVVAGTRSRPMVMHEGGVRAKVRAKVRPVLMGVT